MQILSAVGKKTMDKKGRFMVEASGEEYYLVNMEVYVWSALLWNFVDRNDLDGYVLSLMGQAGRHGDGDWLQRSVKSSEIQYCVSRLLRRGLLVCGEGECAEKAVADLLLKVFVIPNRLPLSLRFRAFCWKGLEIYLCSWMICTVYWRRMQNGPSACCQSIRS